MFDLDFLKIIIYCFYKIFIFLNKLLLKKIRETFDSKEIKVKSLIDGTQIGIFDRKNFYKNPNDLILSYRLQTIKDLSYYISSKNILYLKFFQSVCLNENLLTDHEKQFLISFLDNVMYTNEEIDYESINYLQNTHKINFIDLKPINSGMIALVFNAEKEGKKLIVKIKKINIEYKLQSYIKNITNLTKILSYVPSINNGIDINKIFNDNLESIYKQLDFNSEINNCKKFKNLFSNQKEFVIPEIYEEYSENRDNIIVMENIKGYTIKDIYKNNPNISEDDIDEVGTLFVKFGLYSILFNSAIHNDLHGGNIFFYINDEKNIKEKNLPKIQMGIIDFGVCVFPNRENQDAYFSYFYEINVKKDFTNANKIIRVLAEEKNILDSLTKNQYQIFSNELINIFLKFSDKKLDVIFLNELCKVYRKYGINFSKEFNEICLGLSIVENLGEKLNKNYNKKVEYVMLEFRKINDLLKI